MSWSCSPVFVLPHSADEKQTLPCYVGTRHKHGSMALQLHIPPWLEGGWMRVLVVGGVYHCRGSGWAAPRSRPSCSPLPPCPRCWSCSGGAAPLTTARSCCWAPGCSAGSCPHSATGPWVVSARERQELMSGEGRGGAEADSHSWMGLVALIMWQFCNKHKSDISNISIWCEAAIAVNLVKSCPAGTGTGHMTLYITSICKYNMIPKLWK